MIVTHFIVSDDVERFRRFYTEVLGGTVVFGPEPTNLFVPVGNPTNFAGGQLNSGILLPGSSFTVTFTKAGTYHYICGLHDYLGMVGTVRVTSD